MGRRERCQHQAKVKNAGRETELQCIWETTTESSKCPIHNSESTETDIMSSISNTITKGRRNIRRAGPSSATHFLDTEIDALHITRQPVSAIDDSPRKNRVVFTGCKISNLSISRINIESKLVFEDCTIEDLSILSECNYPIVFRDSEITNAHLNGDLSEVRITDCDIKKIVRIAADCQSLQIRGTKSTLSGPGCIISGKIIEGVLAQPENNRLRYLVDGGTIGDVTLENATPPINDNYWFLNASFDGMEINRLEGLLATSKYKLHPMKDQLGMANSGSLDNEHTPADIRVTYQNAKQQAKAVGENSAASEFYMHEKRWRGKEHRHAAINSHGTDRISSIYDYIANRGFGYISGWGERPSRVVLTSFGLIGLFSLIYVGVFRLFEIAPPYGNSIGYITLSIESFVTLALNSQTTFTNSYVRLLAASEAFLGAFMIALFVFTLTRSINR